MAPAAPGRAVRRHAPSLQDVVETRTSSRIAIVTTRECSSAIESIYQRAGAHVREVQRMTLEEIFVANVMSNRREQAA